MDERMYFGTIGVADALGATLAHGIKGPGLSFKKGRRLGQADLDALRTAGIASVEGVRIEAGDVGEDVAAHALAAAVAGHGLNVAEAFTGRANLFAAQAGIVVLDQPRIHALNRIHQDLTVATLPPFARVAAGDMVATVKIIPFATDRTALDRGLALAGEAAPLLRVHPFQGIAARLIQTRTSATAEKMLDKTVEVTRQRLLGVGGRLLDERRCAHETGALAAAIDEALALGPELILIAGASAVTDRRDVLPAGIVAAGGVVEHVGMPVDPGNLLVFGRHGTTRVLGLPGCARSPKLNGFDWVLERLAAGIEVTPDDIMAMGIGGLLSEIPSRPQPRAGAEPATLRAPRITALVLAAGRSSRMGERNTLLVPLDGKPLVRHAVDAALESACAEVVVVTGHMRPEVEAVLAGTTVRIVHNDDYAQGLSTSLRRGLQEVPADADGVLVMLGDMPKVDRRLVDRLIAAFSPVDGRAIIVPVASGKRGNPVLWARRFVEPMARLAGDAGAKSLIGANEDVVVEIAVDDDAPLLDLDTPEALDAYLEATR